MSTSKTSSTWDFAPVINLLHSLSTGNQSATPVDQVVSATIPPEPDINTVRDGCQRLGDFGPLWDLLSGGGPLGDDTAAGDANLSQEQCLATSQNFKEVEALTESTEKTADRPKIQILLKKKKEENVRNNTRIWPSVFPLAETSDDEAGGPPAPKRRQPLSILQNHHRSVINQPISALPSRISPPCHKSPSVKPSKRIEPLLKCSPTEKRLDLISMLKRGRSISKRVLVGSDRFPAIDEAEEIGYEINILERVQKSKDCTPRKKKFLGVNGNGRCNGATGNNAQGQSSGSETNAGPGLERWVEQGVDEILHLKILESLVDSEAPSTIVLATGDAAEAEYSDGFLKMVGRALQKGWAVELVSFSTTTSRAYKRKEFRSQWGSQFRVIKLDEYVEHLLDA
ncbi:hypothetical protein RJZ90_002016 [Blastomyces dermatitidis]